MRISDQYMWNIIFTMFFIALIIFALLILDTRAYETLRNISVMELTILMLATFRFTRLVVYDKITAFFREQFYDAVTTEKGVELHKPERGARRTLADLLACPWCFGMWAAAFIVFCYALTPFAWPVILFFAIAGVATFIQLIANWIGWEAEKAKLEAGG